MSLELASRLRAVITTARNVLALLGSRAYTSTTAAKRCTAALRLALVILEHKQRIVAGLKFRTHQGLIGFRVAPRAYLVACIQANRVKGADGFISILALGRRATRIG